MSPAKAVPAAELMPLVTAALDRGQHVRMTVDGASMLPFLLPGDEVELAPPDAQPAVGRICLVRCRPNAYLLHRVVRSEPGRVWTQGDGLPRVEGPFEPGQVLAQVVMVRRRGRAWSPERRSTRMLHLLWRAVQPHACRPLAWLWARRHGRLGCGQADHGAASADQS